MFHWSVILTAKNLYEETSLPKMQYRFRANGQLNGFLCSTTFCWTSRKSSFLSHPFGRLQKKKHQKQKHQNIPMCVDSIKNGHSTDPPMSHIE